MCCLAPRVLFPAPGARQLHLVPDSCTWCQTLAPDARHLHLMPDHSTWYQSLAPGARHLHLVPYTCIWCHTLAYGARQLHLLPDTFTLVSDTYTWCQTLVPGARHLHPGVRHLHLMPGTCTWCQTLAPGARHLHLVPDTCTWCQTLTSSARHLHLVPDTCIWCQTLALVPDTCIYCQILAHGARKLKNKFRADFMVLLSTKSLFRPMYCICNLSQKILIFKKWKTLWSPPCSGSCSRAVQWINMFASDSFEEQKSKHVFIMYLSDDPFSGSGQKMTPAPQHWCRVDPRSCSS